MRLLLTISLLCWLAGAQAEGARMLVRSSPLAGSQFYALAEWQGRMQIGDALQLIREPENRHDPLAIRVEWQGHKLGYVPRAHNRAVAAAMDAGEPFVARISRLKSDPDPWQRLEFEVLLVL